MKRQVNSNNARGASPPAAGAKGQRSSQPGGPLGLTPKGTLKFRRRAREYEASDCGNYTVVASKVEGGYRFIAFFRPYTVLGSFDSADAARAQCEVHDAENPDKSQLRTREMMKQYAALYGRGENDE